MFTGIITDIGRIRSVSRGGDTRMEIVTGAGTEGLAVGGSVCCSGACMTAVAVEPDAFAVEVSAESLARTTLGDWQPDTKVNLERSLKVGDELGGHIVSGHVDGVIAIRTMRAEGDSKRVTFDLPDWLAPYVAEKGSIALDGVSLTVNEVEADSFGVNLIAHTCAETTFGDARPGGRVNVEIDMLSRYVRRALEAVGAGTGAAHGP